MEFIVFDYLCVSYVDLFSLIMHWLSRFCDYLYLIVLCIIECILCHAYILCRVDNVMR